MGQFFAIVIADKILYVVNILNNHFMPVRVHLHRVVLSYTRSSSSSLAGTGIIVGFFRLFIFHSAYNASPSISQSTGFVYRVKQRSLIWFLPFPFKQVIVCWRQLGGLFRLIFLRHTVNAFENRKVIFLYITPDFGAAVIATNRNLPSYPQGVIQPWRDPPR